MVKKITYGLFTSDLLKVLMNELVFIFFIFTYLHFIAFNKLVSFIQSISNWYRSVLRDYKDTVQRLMKTLIRKVVLSLRTVCFLFDNVSIVGKVT